MTVCMGAIVKWMLGEPPFRKTTFFWDFSKIGFPPPPPPISAKFGKKTIGSRNHFLSISHHSKNF